MSTLSDLCARAGAAVATCALVGSVAVAQTPQVDSNSLARKTGEIAFRISAQPIEGALREFASQAHIQLIYETERINSSIQSQNVAGEFTPEVALSRLLAHTNLNYKIINSRTVSIRRADDVPATVTQASASTPLVSSETKKIAAGDADTEQVARRATREKGIETITVTAQKREQNILEVPTSIVAVGADELQQRQITTLEDLPSAVPGFSYLKTGSNVYFEIRGVSNSIGTGPLVGVYVDEADMTLGGAAGTQPNPVTYDLERVEVLRGPQGTLYGEGSAGGTIRFITRNPNLNRFSFDSQVTALFTEGGDPSQRINAMANIPLLENQLGLRIATTFEHEGGWIDLTGTDNQHINAQNLTNVRVKGLWKPNSQLTVSAMAIINRDDRSMDYTDSQSPTQWTQSFNLSAAPKIRKDYELYNLTLTYDVSSVARILNTTTYIRASALTSNNGGELPLLGAPGPGGLPPIEFYFPYQATNDRLWTDELRLASTGSGRWQWTVGGFYRRYPDKAVGDPYYFGLPIPLGAPLPPSVPGSASDTVYKSWSAFGDTSYRLSDRFTLGAGIRYFREGQDFSDLVAVTRQTGQFHSLDPRAYAQFKLARDVNLYASAAKGFRSGGFNTGADQPTFGPESVWTYEMGTKMVAMGGRIGFDASVFWSNYTDYQTSGLTSTNNLIPSYTNAGKARIKGIESSVTWRPFDHWRLDFRGDYLDTKFLEVNTLPNPITGLPSSGFVVGDTLNYVPRYQFTASGQREFLWLGRQGFIRLDYSQQGPETLRARNFGSWFYGQSDVIKLLNLRTSLRLSDNLNVGFSAQNLLNDQGFVNPLSFERSGVRSRPRTYGVDFSATFD